ncbi:type IVB secretion system protein IcmH/DotU [Pseudomonas syringae]|uniref:type IVB secretion system protein IcmH/DotU n=1 Tax=Pseudomonas syringae TaxID=317 RepID=UPI00068BB389|nr:type IVB secretion system protein IcmH/DotU [Pseudomonas syringae]
MTDAPIANPDAAPDNLQPGLPPERSLMVYDVVLEQLRPGDEADAARLAASYNPLVAAASRLLSGIARLKPHPEVSALHGLRARLGKRIKRFNRQTLQAGVDPKQVQIASYVLCTVADEAVLTSDWGMNSDWARTSLLNSFHGETSGGVKFFLLLERYMRIPAGHIEVLELMYLCLMLGYEGRYAAATNGGKQLQNLRQDLYQCIQRVRGETSSKVSLVQLPRRHAQRRTLLHIPGWLPISLTLFSLALLYSGFAWVLDKQRDKALIPFQLLDSAPVVSVMDGGRAR